MVEVNPFGFTARSAASSSGHISLEARDRPRISSIRSETRPVDLVILLHRRSELGQWQVDLRRAGITGTRYCRIDFVPRHADAAARPAEEVRGVWLPGCVQRRDSLRSVIDESRTFSRAGPLMESKRLHSGQIVILGVAAALFAAAILTASSLLAARIDHRRFERGEAVSRLRQDVIHYQQLSHKRADSAEVLRRQVLELTSVGLHPMANPDAGIMHDYLQNARWAEQAETAAVRASQEADSAAIDSLIQASDDDRQADRLRLLGGTLAAGIVAAYLIGAWRWFGKAA